MAGQVSSDLIREAWARDLNSDISAELWEVEMTRINSSINSHYKINPVQGVA